MFSWWVKSVDWIKMLFADTDVHRDYTLCQTRLLPLQTQKTSKNVTGQTCETCFKVNENTVQTETAHSN